MYLRDVAASMLRRWYLTLAGLLLTVGLVALALQLVHPGWESKANLVLLPPKSTIVAGGNPYLQLGGLAPTLDLLVVSMGDAAMTDTAKQISPTATYTVKADTASAGPVLIVTAVDRTSRGSINLRDELVRQVPLRLAALQDSLSISRNSRINMMVVTQDPDAKIVSKNQIRAVVVAAGAGLLGTALIVAFIDGVLMRRRRDRLSRVAAVLQSTEVPVEEEIPSRVVAATEWDRRRVARADAAVKPAEKRPRPPKRDGRPPAINPAVGGWSWGEVEPEQQVTERAAETRQS